MNEPAEPTPTLPQEILLAIFHYVEYIPALLLTSRNFHSLAEPLLYGYIELSVKTDSLQFQLFSNTIISRPTLAAHTHTLRIPIPLPGQDILPHFVNLQRLCLTQKTVKGRPWQVLPFSNPTSRLTHVILTQMFGEDPAEIATFLELQTSLVHLYLTSRSFEHALATGTHSFPVGALQSLRSLVTTPELAVHILPRRQVENLHLVTIYDLGDIFSRSTFPTVKSLSCSMFIAECVNHFPNLKYLQIDETESILSIEENFKGLIAHHRNLSNVEYLSISFHGPSLSMARGSFHPPEDGVEILRNLPKLRTVDLVLTWVKQRPEFFRYSISRKNTTVAMIERDQGDAVNVDRRKSTHYIGKVGEGKWGWPHDQGLCGAITKHYKPSLKSFLNHEDNPEYFNARPPRRGDLGAFEKLPSEIIAMIIGQLQDMVLFGITNSQLLALAFPILSSYMMEYLSWVSSWSGDRILYLGDCAEGLPEGFLSDEEKLDLLEGIPEEARLKQEANFDLYSLAYEFEKTTLCSLHVGMNAHIKRMLLHYDRGRDYHRYEAFRNVVVLPQRPNRVLVNLSKKEYVKETVEGVDFTIMIMPMIIWSEEETAEWGIDACGPWAGDRIAVISAEDFASRVSKGKWTDVVEKGLDLQARWLEAFSVNHLPTDSWLHTMVY
ncbi:hypothetical protein ONZ45_g6473 [Pleurotus djamor]|nr:hypothetical protein ONZ45_g6473 [Pleurotus djamor]